MTSAKNAHEYWWQSLAAIPASERTHDWWSSDTLGRWRPYDRLKRVWADQTSPKDNLHKPDTERHLTATLWENFVLWHPRIWIPRLFAAAGLPAPRGTVRDACWSYEFEQSKKGTRACEMIADVVLHYRDDDGDNLLVTEAKNLGCDLGKSPKDRDPGFYLQMRSFADVPSERRRLIYLVDAAKKDVVAAQIRGDTPWKFSLLTWQQLATVQVALARELTVNPLIAATVAALIEEQFDAHRITPLDGKTYRFNCNAVDQDATLTIWQRSTNEVAALVIWVVQFEGEIDDSSGDPVASAIRVLWTEAGPMPSLSKAFEDTPPYLLQYLAGALQYRLGREIRLPHPAFPYLRNQPSFAQCWKTYSQQPEERTGSLWRLP